jgi:hypothetical protein
VSDDACFAILSTFTDRIQEAKTPAFVIEEQDVKMITPAVKIIWDNFAKLRKHAVFQKLLNEEHGLAVALLNLSAERQRQVQGGNGDLE